MRLVVSAVLVVLSASAAVAGESWKVSEGAGASVSGVWNITRSGAGAFSGNAVMRKADGGTLSYGVVGKVDGSTYTVQRVKSSDGLTCSYMGSISPPKAGKKGLQISGSSTCRGVTGAWTVVEMPKSR